MICPYFKNELCSIYDKRPSCCRNFPNRTEGMFCSDSECVYTVEGELDCENCLDKCCRHIVADKVEDILKVLDTSCEDCKTIYCKDDRRKRII